MLDNALGALSSVKAAILEIGEHFQATTGRTDQSMAKLTNTSKRAARLGSAAAGGGMVGMGDSEDAQFDNILPPELPTSWVQCEVCHKWRRVAWHVDADSLPDDWRCEQNTWEPESASCETPQDSWDPERESTVESKGMASVDDAALTVGSWRDVYCITNCVYYEGQILEVKPGAVDAQGRSGCPMLHFKFKGWANKFNEWVAADSSRIQPHNLYTDPTTQCARAQERWQGRKPVATVLINADRGKSGGKGKSSGGSKKRKAAAPAGAGAGAGAGAEAAGEEIGAGAGAGAEGLVVEAQAGSDASASAAVASE